MSPSLPSIGTGSSPLPVTGIDARWILSFQREDAKGALTGDPFDVACDNYTGEIQATLPNGLDPGSYRFTVRGLSDDDYSKINLADNQHERVTLYLYWGDDGSTNPALAYAENMLGIGGSSQPSASIPHAMVAVLAVTGVKRTAGELTYDVEISARERVYDVLARTTLCGATIPGQSYAELITELGGRLNWTAKTDYVYYAVDNEPDQPAAIRTGQTALQVIQPMAQRLEDACKGKRCGRGMYLQRNGVLHIGPRQIPLAGGDPVTIDEPGGLLTIEQTGRVTTDPNFQACGVGQTSSTATAPTRRQYKLTCHGRPDIKPGDLVSFTPQPQDDAHAQGGGLVGAVADIAASLGAGTSQSGTAVVAYVESVQHKLSRTDGFSTVITGAEITKATDGSLSLWDHHTTITSGGPRQAAPATTASSESRAADSIVRLVRRLVGESTGAEVGEVRAVEASGDQAQTLTVWRGLAAAQNDGGAGQARRLDIERPSRSEQQRVPYLTPFAWGACGLVLPCYPGSRMLLEDRNGMADDPVALGSMWQAGHTPDNAHAGDWWLILPVGVSHRDSVDPSWTPSDFGGNATNDLIDGDGARAIEAKTLSIDTGDLHAAGDRPGAIDSGVALRLRLQQGGNEASIVIKTDGSIELDSSAGISIKSAGDLNIKAANVKVKVSGTMDVSKG